MQNIYVKTYFPKQKFFITTTSIILAFLLIFGILVIAPPKAEAVNILTAVTPAAAATLLTGSNLTVVPNSVVVYGAGTQPKQFDSVNLGGSRTLANAGIYLNSSGNISLSSLLKTAVNALPQPRWRGVTNMSALEYSVTAPAGITSISLQYLFGSNESCTQSWDIAAIFVDGINYAKLANGNTITVDPSSGLVSVNPNVSGFSTSCWTNTYTMVGLFNMALTTHKIQIVVGDTGDYQVPSTFAVSLITGGTATSGGIVAGTLSGAPTIGLATATGATTATVAFTAPASNGGSTITSYTATSSPTGGSGTLTQAGSGTISVTGLTTGVAYTFTVTATNSAGTSVASAASNSVTNSYVATITVPETTYVSASATTNITGLSVGGLAAGSTYQVALALSPIPTGASLKLTTTTGLTASTGFTSGSNTFSSFTTITFSGLLSNINNALATLQYVSGATTGSPVVQVTVSSLDTNYALNGYNGHFYVSNTTLGLANATYLNARTTAKLQSYRGLTGYLTTITSAGENSFISNNIASALNIIFGATDELVEGVWRWDTSGGSPEAGTQFWQGAANGSAVGGQYSAWSSGNEPNDSGGEDYPVTNWGGNLGIWNDCNNTICGAGTAKYVVEFGTSATDGGFVNSSSNLASSSFSLFYATSGQLPTVLTVDPQSSSRYLPTTLNTVGPTNLLLCLNESDASGVNLVSPTINFDVAANGAPATTAGTGTSTIYGDRTTATYIYGVTANVISTLNSVLGTQIYLSSGAFSATKYIKIRAISIASSSSIGSKTCASTVYTSQNIEIRPLVLQRIMKKGTITLKQ